MAAGTNSCSNSSFFGVSSPDAAVTPVMLPPRAVRLATSPSATGSNPPWKTIGMVVVAVFSAQRRGPVGGDHGHLACDQIGSERRQAAIATFRPAKFDGHVAALDKAGLAQALAERAHPARPQVGRFAAEEPDHRHRRLLRVRRQRPRCRRAARGGRWLPDGFLIQSPRRRATEVLAELPFPSPVRSAC